MYKILITDDEQIVIDSLSFIINKNFDGQVELFTATSGPEAIDICTQNEIDIVFMDIRMPGMTGLEAIKCILNLKPQTVIIILSAFDSFEYAQEALNLGAFKYITKPITKNIVIQIIRNAMNAVDSRKAFDSDDIELQKKLEKVSPVLESDFFYNCIFSRANSEDIYTYLDYFNITEHNFLIACFELQNLNPHEADDFYQKTKSLIHENAKCLVSSMMANRIIVFFYFDNPEDQNVSVNECAHKKVQDLFSILQTNLKCGLHAGASDCFQDVREIADKYIISLNALNSASQNEPIVFSDETKSVDEKSDESEQMIFKIYNRLRIGDSNGVAYLVNSYLDSLHSQKKSLDFIKSQVFEILVNAQNILREISSKNKESCSQEFYSVISSISDETMLGSYAVETLEKITAEIQEIRSHRGNPIISKVIKYLDENISEDLSLELAAKVAGVNPFYLSKLFREETGDTFVNYISEKRLDKAKELLANSDLSVKEITAEIGYNDQNYLSKLFKARFGISPTDFRKTK